MNPSSTMPDIDAPNDLELAFHLAGVGLCICRERVIQRCNQAFGMMFGYAPEALAGCSLALLYPSQNEFEHTGSRSLLVMQASGSYSDERIMRRQDGSLFWCHVIGRSLYPAQPFACTVWSFEDISAKRPVTVKLTGREREVAQFLILGKATKEIATILQLSARTVEAHRARLIHKFGVKTTVELMSKLSGFS